MFERVKQCNDGGTRSMSGRLSRTLLMIAIRLGHLVANAVGDDVVGRHIRRMTFAALGARFGRGASMHGGCYVSKPWNLVLGDRAFLNRNCYLDLEARVALDDDVAVGHGVTFITTVHHIGPSERRCGAYTAKAIHVGRGAWIGANVTILPGVRIGGGAVIGPGAIVDQDIPRDTFLSARRLSRAPADRPDPLLARAP
jgi:maltose O-acetyltransferase